MDGVVSWGDLVNGDCKKITWLDPKILGTSWLANSLPLEPPASSLTRGGAILEAGRRLDGLQW